ncbi:indolepyruvate ferredoxin oxidoreductase family protein [Phenylobacterium sp.]|uniref:indolepyruvate ferredoxin oxidoreductase family protein n=1 Tax=Phenylobacterium sp. TaxID=1871053 RepID=UPI00289F24D6|nr:indolepyruvate ferredoxin oxidoreductase family protein [Phenylobacterium sp.]
MSAVDLQFSLDDVYSREAGRLYMSGIQALVRLPLMQRRLDRARGLSTAGLISGYRGSPLGAYDQQLWRAEKHLKSHDVVFQPGLNEDLAATALWGAQMHRAYGPARVDGVFGVWYGKGPGVDRSGDVFRNANMLGTSRLGGVVALAGDDHSAQSSMFPHQTDAIFHSVSMPVVQPSSVRDILTLGLSAFALSRYAGVWVAMKTIAEVVESAASFEAPDPLPRFVAPADFLPPPHGLNWDPSVTWPGARAELERRLIEERLPAVAAWARANGLDGIVQDAPRRRIVLVTVGKAHQDVMEAFARLGVDAARAGALGVAIYKVALSWPLETSQLQVLAQEAELVVVVEEKRGFVEDQLKAALYNIPASRRAAVIGKRDRDGAPLFPEILEFTPLLVARALSRVLGAAAAEFAPILAKWEAQAARPDVSGLVARRPFFCAGCPHNTSTRTPDGSIAGGGIGCHVMALSEPKLKTSTFSQMGGEGAQWIGAEPFAEAGHIFQNLGDGTYQHSGLLAVRAAVAADANMTFKILYNDAVAMTGGQPAEGRIDPKRITRQLAAEGVSRIALVSEQPDRWRGAEGLATGITFHGREALDAVQRELREIPGVTAIVYEQTCASEKRRRRKRGAFPDPDRRLFINPRVCEGCGDCQIQSNCIAVEPLETAFGVKRRINQSACNKDFSCVKGFCPSFVEIEGATPPRPDEQALAKAAAALFDALPQPRLAALDRDFNVFVAGVGGTGVLTLGALLGTAAHVEGLAATTLDFTGLAQKNGAVTSQVRIAADPGVLHAVRIGEGALDLMLAADIVVGSSADAQMRLDSKRTLVVLNEDAAPTADAVADRDARLPLAAMRRAIGRKARRIAAWRTTSYAEAIFGEAATANTLLLGYAWQLGALPLSEAAILRAIEINGVAVDANKKAFRWGRAVAHDEVGVAQILGMRTAPIHAETVAELVGRLAGELTAYQDRAYAARFEALVDKVRQAEGSRGEALARVVATQAYRLMAYKDEYEVARLYADPEFRGALGRDLQGSKKISLWLSPPFMSRPDAATGRPRKRRFGPWILPVMGWLARGKALRGTMLDPFGRTEERRAERQLVSDYFADIDRICASLTDTAFTSALALAEWPAQARGYGPVKAAGMARAAEARARLWAAYENRTEAA